MDYEVDNNIEIKLAIESPLKGGKHSIDVALFCKRFMTVLMAEDSNKKLQKWETLTEYTIAYDKDTISKYYSGMKMKSDRKRIVGFTCISSPVIFAQIKNHSIFFIGYKRTNCGYDPQHSHLAKRPKLGGFSTRTLFTLILHKLRRIYLVGLTRADWKWS